MAGDPPHTRRQFIKGAGALVALSGASAGAVFAFWPTAERQRLPALRDGMAPTLDHLRATIVSGGPGRDGIPTIDRPNFVGAEEAGFLDDEDVVFGIVHRGEARAYPQLVLVWHEIVNDVIAGDPLSVTYCPLTGSVVAFQRATPGPPVTFGTTGKLLNSNLLMYDRATESEWPQLLGQAIDGKAAGASLIERPLIWTTWGRWRRAHPNGAVLSTRTDFARPYGQDPYGSYTPVRGYYKGGGPIFPVLASSDRLAPKEVVVGVKSGAARLAIRKSRIRRAGVLPVGAGGVPLLAVWDGELESARVFVRRARGRTLRFADGELRDSSGSTWTPSGRALAGPLAGAQLAAANFLDAMWFAWYAFFPQTELVV